MGHLAIEKMPNSSSLPKKKLFLTWIEITKGSEKKSFIFLEPLLFIYNANYLQVTEKRSVFWKHTMDCPKIAHSKAVYFTMCHFVKTRKWVCFYVQSFILDKGTGEKSKNNKKL